MIRQPPLFVENALDALRAIVQHLGGAKVVGATLWPAKSIEDARTLLLNCLNPERPEKLDVDQIILLLRLARESDFHLAKHYIDHGGRMTSIYHSQYSLGTRVHVLGVPGRVVAITFSELGDTRYEIRFDAGGVNSIVDGGQIMEAA